jgi:anaerobic selenocysteine-containing dehydrogenase
MREQKYRTCNLCEAMCGMVVTVEDGAITDIRGDRDDVLSRGHICPKGPAMREIQEDPDRLRHPVRRTASGWERVSWEQALGEVASRLHDVQARHGRDAVGVYLGNPLGHNHGALLMAQAFLVALGSRNRFDANSQDANPKLYAAMHMYGELIALTVPDVDRTDFLLMLGANPAASGGSVMGLGDVRGRMRAIRDRGGKVVLIDPRRTESADMADEYHPIRPGGDAALLLAMLHVLFAERLVDEAAVSKIAHGVADLRTIAARFSPERVAGAVGIDAGAIRTIATAFARAPRAVAYGRVGVCLNEFGPVASWLIEALNVVTGNFDRPGGSMFPTPAVDLAPIVRLLGLSHSGQWKSRLRGLPEIGGMLPAAAMAEEMETPGDGQIRAFVTVAGNPVLSVPSGERLGRALDGLEFMVSVDIYLNETTRHANLVLPPRYALERAHFDLLMHALAVRNTVKWSEPVVTPDPESRDEWSILQDLSMRLGAHRLGGGLGRKAAGLVSRLGQLGSERVIDLLLRMGHYGSGLHPFKDGLTLEKVRRAPHGIDLGPLVPMRHQRVTTPSGLVELAPPALVKDIARVEQWLERPADGLLLIGRRHMRSNNSWMHNIHSLTKGPDRSTLLMHEEDARGRGMAAGDQVRVTSRVGSVTVRLEMTKDILPGVVSLPHGFGHAAAAGTMRIAGALAGVNVNAITDDLLVEPLTGTAILNGVPVTVEALDAGE